MSLDTLPAEILFEVFSSLSGFADATNLCRVSWNIRSFKLCNEASIFLALAPRCMASYQDASELIAAQNEHNPIDASQYTEDLGRSDLLYSKFKANALAVSKAADLYEGYLRPFLPMPKPKVSKARMLVRAIRRGMRRGPTKGNDSNHESRFYDIVQPDRALFKSLFYTTLLLEAYPSGLTRRPVYNRTSLRRLWCIRILVEWAAIELSPEQQACLGVKEEEWMTLLTSVLFNIEKKRRRLGTPVLIHGAEIAWLSSWSRIPLGILPDEV
ncbi:MAG: hypothetical protein MMC23_007320 [Stictis urceolatum]|nr:hypothetical protein [Stictis urceolata]